MSEFNEARVLVADDASVVRQSVRMTLSQSGISRVDTAASVGETRRRLKNGVYDVVLCDYYFGEGTTGQELLEEMRHTGELPLGTIWFMITAEASYEKVVAVAEVGPDDYLIKPFTSAKLTDRLKVAWDKKQFFRPVYDKIEQNDPNGAIEVLRDILEVAEQYRNDALRLLSNLLLQTGRLDEARVLLEEVLQNRVVPWAKLNLARVLNKQGNKTQAEAALQAAINDHAQYVDAYEELANMYMTEGRLDEAMAVFDKCLSMTPNNVSRLQKAGNLANMMGDSNKARQLLEKAVTCGGNSSVLAPETVLQLALAARRDQASADAEKYLKMVSGICQREETLKNRVVGALASALFSGKAEALNDVAEMLSRPDFTLELAVNWIMTADQVCPPTVDGEQANDNVPPYKWLAALARRFITTKYISGMLESAASQRPAWAHYIQQVGQDVSDLNRDGVQVLMKNQFSEALAKLLPAAESTYNHRLMLSATHAGIKAMQAGEVADGARRKLILTLDQFLERLEGMTDEGVLYSMRNDLNQLSGGK
ncbi:Tetratricopeptide repeat-containing protein [Andreprevotia lacus DSM 23236]|jgi:CheY-like chemotaxis protein|uniref:Tetratricopeptide repeat-containing protein n=1 Tax=Andreprevotia lacus DSM 23236 TaxID=1121001 RepID=A0A1W1XMY1_9NEIS|nr:response regulator [Andreprevotia lacus]SMC25222.1 Tetratricopeptide repeat-containing protein [Andreprevotia lacus DSM 23236]